jgi:hypothetical protein
MIAGLQHRYLPKDVAAYVYDFPTGAGLLVRGGSEEGPGRELRFPDGVYHAGPQGTEGLQPDADRRVAGLESKRLLT